MSRLLIRLALVCTLIASACQSFAAETLGVRIKASPVTGFFEVHTSGDASLGVPLTLPLRDIVEIREVANHDVDGETIPVPVLRIVVRDPIARVGGPRSACLSGSQR